MAKRFIKHDIIEECSVCMEKNTVLTKCGHNLCRICLCKMRGKCGQHRTCCPLCRKCLCSLCQYEDDDDDDA